MENNRKIVTVVFCFMMFLGFSIPLVLTEGLYTGMFLVGLCIFAGAFARVRQNPAPKAESHQTVMQTPAVPTHRQQYLQSYRYSETENLSTEVKDKPLSEAERNVLYGK